MKYQKIPTIMYHSIGVTNPEWHWNYLTCPYNVFENQLKWIERAGYTTLIFEEVYDYIMNDKEIPKKAVFLTFDDGYLDNYVFAYPLLKKYGMKGTIFINPDFVDKSNGLREVYNGYNQNHIKNSGFCNWDELKYLDEQGVLDVQSHAKTHTWYPVSDKVIDFRHPGDDYIWMDWNNYPDEKSNLQIIDKSKARFGEAIFENKKALMSPRVFISQNVQDKLNSYVNENGGISFFQQDNWRSQLSNLYEGLKNEFLIISHKETRNDFLERIEFELAYSKKAIEQKLNKKIEFLCWPGGSGTVEGVQIAKKLGYKMSTAALDLTNQERKKILNSPVYKISRIARFTPVFYNNWRWRDNSKKIKYSPGWYLILQFWRFENKYYANFWVKGLSYLVHKTIKNA